MTLKRLFALLLALAFLFGTTAVALAQPKPGAAKAAEKAKAAKEQLKEKIKETIVQGQVKTVSGDSLVVVDKSNQEWTFAVSGKTAESAQKLKAGDSVVVRYTEADGKKTATKVMHPGAAKNPCAAKQ
ncbi:MAG: hypothetical protein HY724_05395 [Candidatus Rokubacteria bacterium]|nr:hypothetical protein [Candidatus Rokubacteria bacterium]